jgi:hypothetical protein
MVGHEKRIEAAPFQGLGEPPQMRKIEIGVGKGAGISPGAGVNADGAHESAKPQLLGCCHRLLLAL